MTVGDSSEGSITGMLPIKDHLYILKERAIYSVQMADQIDPKRENIRIPNVYQLVVSSGTESEIVGRTLLTARELFREHRIDSSIDHEAALLIGLELMKEVLGSEKILNKLRESQSEAERKLEPAKGGAFQIPAIGDVEGHAKGFVQKAEHAVQALYRLASLFFGPEMPKKGWFDGFAEMVQKRYGSDDPFTEFVSDLTPFCKLVRNLRHCVEHAQDGQRLILKDFHLVADGTLSPPTIEVVHRETPLAESLLVNFMEEIVSSICSASEDLMGFLSAKHLQPFGNFEIAIGRIPEEQIRDKVRIGYFIKIGGDFHRLS